IAAGDNMQKWKYLRVWVAKEIVMQINGKEVGKVAGLLASPKGEHVVDFLDRVGQEGWELVSDAPVAGSASAVGHYMTFKKPIS
ncbi:MAG: hypothetical protein K8J31_15440, partial [Anaerolineae bacterium]|nr:hypothetical protein [Anaerolineae bacterium]